jgi:hypothetical protein
MPVVRATGDRRERRQGGMHTTDGHSEARVADNKRTSHMGDVRDPGVQRLGAQ